MTRVERSYDRLRWRLRRWRGLAPVSVEPYIGYGTPTALFVRGRALAGKPRTPATREDSLWRNLVNVALRFHTHEIPHARVRARFDGTEKRVRANVEGYFGVQLDLPAPLPGDEVWYQVEVALTDYLRQRGALALAEVLVPPAGAQFGVVSDLDDTVIQTDVLHLVNMARNTFLHNAYTRLPFKGVAAFYRALQRGTAEGQNPIFYVSNGPYNLYDLLVDFFKLRNIPLGPFFLTDLGLTEDHFVRRSSVAHKTDHITLLLERYPRLPFILVGDSGEQDGPIYLDVARRFPGRVRAIYIRAVEKDPDLATLLPLVEESRALGTELLLVETTVAAAEHAAARGYILPDALPIIREERREDEQAATAAEQLIADVTRGEKRS